ncbi:hypothetical protein EC988_005369 [Linderina pennispora]|nr:hypothetical protein EC988_005369 [Linderina pennispora]
MTTVAFNRIQYAKLASQNIDVDYQLPKPESPDYKACVMGMKISDDECNMVLSVPPTIKADMRM